MKLKNTLKNLIKKNAFVQRIYRGIFSVFFRFVGLFVKTNNIVLFSSASGLSYGDSPKTLYEAIVKDPFFSKYVFYWAFEKPNSYQIKDAKIIKIDSFKYFIVALKSKVWITSVNIERGLHFKKKKTIYINTWHGTGPKYSGNKVAGRKDYDFSNVDIMCVDGWYLKKIMVEDHKALPEKCFVYGRPREDFLLNYAQEDINSIKKELNLPLDKKILLMAPTWRETEKSQMLFENSVMKFIQLFRESLQSDYLVLFRSHVFSSPEKKVIFDDFFIDATGINDINKLYLISDILVSDYSSVFFDFGLLKKPMFCYAPDYNEYIIERGMYIDLKKEFPGGVYENEEKLVNDIKNMHEIEITTKCTQFISKYIDRPANSTTLVLNHLKSLLEMEKKL